MLYVKFYIINDMHTVLLQNERSVYVGPQNDKKHPKLSWQRDGYRDNITPVKSPDDSNNIQRAVTLGVCYTVLGCPGQEVRING